MGREMGEMSKGDMLKFDRKQQNSVKLDSFSHSTFYSGILSISEMFSFFNYIKVSLCDY